MNRHLGVFTGAAVVSPLVLLGTTLPAGAAPAPSVTVVMVCAKGVPGTWDGALRGIYNISFRDASGATVGFGTTLDCPAAGGRLRAKFTTTAPAAAATVSCWNGSIQVGNLIGALPLKGTCVDNVDGGGTYATVTVR